MNLKRLKSLFADNGCGKIFIKRLAPNDNSKNQVYFGGSFDILNILPISEIRTVEAGDWEKERFKASMDFAWIGEDGRLFPAPTAQLILYPKYPEVRFSGFLMGCHNPPRSLMTQRLADRLLFFSVAKNGCVLGYVAAPVSEIAREFLNERSVAEHGVFKVIELPKVANNRKELLEELSRIHQQGWIKSKRLHRSGNLMDCQAENCGGYTLEAELGITPNGYSEPDFLGWEVKQFGVEKFENAGSAVITLMTPEPTDGLYKSEGAESFIRKYGYPDKNGKADRMNFGGVHKAGKRHELTTLELRLVGFDLNSGKIRNTNGRIALFDRNDVEAASWPFASMLQHWNRKHNQACYVPSMSEKEPERKYRYGNNIILGTGTDFQLFLCQMAAGNIYYDPGIKMENASTNPTIKKRSQFRIKSRHLASLYQVNEIVDISGHD